MISVGIFSGSFDPVHIGHLALANYLCEYEALDEVWFLVTPQNPRKKVNPQFPAAQRLQWIKDSIRNYPHFKVSDFEHHLPEPHYTINTLRALQAQYPGYEFSLIIGADNWTGFDQWYDYDSLLKEFNVIVYPRKGYDCDPDKRYPRVRFSQAPLIEISSTFIRESLRKGRDLRFFMPEGVKF